MEVAAILVADLASVGPLPSLACDDRNDCDGERIACEGWVIAIVPWTCRFLW